MSFRNASLTAYLNSLSPVWVRRWAFRVLMLEKSALHRLHLNDFPLVWVSWWYFKVNFCAKALLQTPHLNYIRDGLKFKEVFILLLYSPTKPGTCSTLKHTTSPSESLSFSSHVLFFLAGPTPLLTRKSASSLLLSPGSPPGGQSPCWGTFRFKIWNRIMKQYLENNEFHKLKKDNHRNGITYNLI